MEERLAIYILDDWVFMLSWGILTAILAWMAYRKNYNFLQLCIQVLSFVSLYVVIKRIFLPVMLWANKGLWTKEPFVLSQQFYVYNIFYNEMVWKQFLWKADWFFTVFVFAFFFTLRYKKMRHFGMSLLAVILIIVSYVIKVVAPNYIYSIYEEWVSVPDFLFIILGYYAGYLCVILLRLLRPKWIERIDRVYPGYRAGRDSYEMSDL